MRTRTDFARYVVRSHACVVRLGGCAGFVLVFDGCLVWNAVLFLHKIYFEGPIRRKPRSRYILSLTCAVLSRLPFDHIFDSCGKEKCNLISDRHYDNLCCSDVNRVDLRRSIVISSGSVYLLIRSYTLQI